MSLQEVEKGATGAELKKASEAAASLEGINLI